MRPLLCLLLAIVAGSLSAAEPAKIYSWKDEKGVVHYSDKPHVNAKEVVVEDSQQFAIPKANPDVLKPEEPAATGVQWAISIASPGEEETVRDNEGRLQVDVQVAPGMERGQRVQPFLDGQPFGPARTIPAFELKDIERGEHKLKIQLIDHDNKILAESKERTFFMHKASALSPARKGGN
ncbi:DUF4124 domain-containing protein [Gallaecimonas kandeliae]|uniref:DUF4124 domain-containing protein n=1 Tax=Gallaecimonas kandeliae TaxID=3029055 RepID=UPI002648A978|nr:DUF4124 domain-containing protein [Gallaecimonas kandeliae]WKE65495.1 DUF4124 domain-containing protein [Gallaecimonas kandeliae]